MIDLAINVSQIKDWYVIILKGELDDHQTSKLIQTFNKIIDELKQYKIILNLNNVTFIDSVGLGTIAIAGKKLMMHSTGQLNLVCNQKKIIKMIDLSGIITATSGKIMLFSSIEEACDPVKASSN